MQFVEKYGPQNVWTWCTSHYFLHQFYLDAALEYISDKFLVFFNFDINNHYAKTYSLGKFQAFKKFMSN